MKKIATSLIALSTLTTILSADFVRVEMGAGTWMQTPSGTIKGTTNGEGGSLITYTDTSKEDSENQNYAWAYIKHPLPILPNLRLDYATLASVGTAQLSGQMLGFTVQDTGNTPTSLDITQYDITPYYNLLDNTFWVSVDVGVDIRFMTTDYVVGGNKLVDNESLVLPLLYSRLRTEVPFTGLGVEAVIKWISDGGDNTISDMFIKADYTFDISPIVQPGLEIGYRVMSMQSYVDNGDDTSDIDLTFEGLYVGGMLRF